MKLKSATTMEPHQYGHQWTKKICRINGFVVLMRVFFTRKCMVVFARWPKKVAVITR